MEDSSSDSSMIVTRLRSRRRTTSTTSTSSIGSLDSPICISSSSSSSSPSPPTVLPSSSSVTIRSTRRTLSSSSTTTSTTSDTKWSAVKKPTPAKANSKTIAYPTKPKPSKSVNSKKVLPKFSSKRPPAKKSRISRDDESYTEESESEPDDSDSDFMIESSSSEDFDQKDVFDLVAKSINKKYVDSANENSSDAEAFQDESALPVAARLSSYPVNSKCDAFIGGRWFPVVVQFINIHMHEVVVNHPEWPPECAHCIDPVSKNLAPFGTYKSKYSAVIKPKQVFSEPSLPSVFPNAAKYQWPCDVSWLRLGELSCQIISDRVFPTDPEIWHCSVAENESDRELWESIQFWLTIDNSLVQATILSITELTDASGKSIPSVKGTGSVDIVNRLVASPDWARFHRAEKKGAKISELVSKLKQAPKIGPDALADDSSDSEDKADAEDGDERTLNEDIPEYDAMKLMAKWLNSRVLHTYQVTVAFDVNIEAEKSSPISTDLSLLPLNALMGHLFPELRSPHIELAERPPPSNIANRVTLDGLMSLSVRNIDGKNDLINSDTCVTPRTSSSFLHALANDKLKAPGAMEKIAEDLSAKCNLNITLCDYQCQTVEWMLEQEREGNHTNMYLWKELPLMLIPKVSRGRYSEKAQLLKQKLSENSRSLVEKRNYIQGPMFWYSAILQAFRFKGMPDMRGGWNAEEMGLGKTISMMSILNEEKSRLSRAEIIEEMNQRDSGIADSLHILKVQPTNSSSTKKEFVNNEVGNLRLTRSAARTAVNQESSPMEIEEVSDGDTFDDENGHSGGGEEEEVEEFTETLDNRDSQGRVFSAATFIVCPVSLIGQWVNELTEKSTKPLRVLAFHGGNRPRTIDRLLNWDVVITSYNICQTEVKHGQRKADNVCLDTPWLYEGRFAPTYQSLLSRIHWRRIVLDECHTIRTMSAQCTRAIYEYVGDRKWLLSGTVLNTSLSDLRGQCKFLELKGLNGRVWNWTDNILVQQKKYMMGRANKIYQRSLTSKKRLINIFVLLVTHSMIRHEKRQTFGGRGGLIELPPKRTQILQVQLNDTERNAITEMFEHAKSRFLRYRAENVAVRRSVEVLQLLAPVRRCLSGFFCWDMRAYRQRMEEELKRDETRTVIDKVKESGFSALSHDLNLSTVPAYMNLNDQCVICLDIMENPVQTPCRHLMCGECITSMLMSLMGKNKGQGACPVCRRTITLDQLTKPMGSTAEEDSSDAPGGNSENLISLSSSAAVGDDIITFDSKLKLLVRELWTMRTENPNSKALIFTQYLHTMELLKALMTEEGFLYQTLEGHMTMRQRKKNLDQFRNDPECCVFLLSMRAGSVGLTLTSASHVFILEPCINPALEQQAIGRIHRLGNQHKEVVVKYLVVSDSVEENIMSINASKLEALNKLKEQHQTENGSVDGELAENVGTGEGARKGRFGSYGHSAAASMHSNNLGINSVAQGSLKVDQASFRLSELEKLFLVEPEAQTTEESTEDNDNAAQSNPSNNNSSSTSRSSNSRTSQSGSRRRGGRSWHSSSVLEKPNRGRGSTSTNTHPLSRKRARASDGRGEDSS